MGTDEKDKKKYEAPVIVPLGELASAMGTPATCENGSGALGACKTGVMANPGGGGCNSGTCPQLSPCSPGS